MNTASTTSLDDASKEIEAAARGKRERDKHGHRYSEPADRCSQSRIHSSLRQLPPHHRTMASSIAAIHSPSQLSCAALGRDGAVHQGPKLDNAAAPLPHRRASRNVNPLGRAKLRTIVSGTEWELYEVAEETHLPTPQVDNKKDPSAAFTKQTHPSPRAPRDPSQGNPVLPASWNDRGF